MGDQRSRQTAPARLGSNARRPAGDATRNRAATTTTVAAMAPTRTTRWIVPMAGASLGSGSTSSRLPATSRKSNRIGISTATAATATITRSSQVRSRPPVSSVSRIAR
jgi:hypothetical protein